ncbi:MAG: hypothetical protein WBJ13_01295 [Sedimentibacter sp.]
MPIEESLLYVEPIYLKSDTESNFPEMKMVVVSYGDKIVMEPTLDQATLIFNEATEAQKNGNWADYGERLEELEEILNQLNLLTNGM